MTPETREHEYPYSVKIETPTGKSATVPIAFLTPTQVQDFLQVEFNKIAQEAGIKGSRLLVERAAAADYAKVISEVTECLRSATASKASRP
jgi:hypothetical protein